MPVQSIPVIDLEEGEWEKALSFDNVRVKRHYLGADGRRLEREKSFQEACLVEASKGLITPHMHTSVLFQKSPEQRMQIIFLSNSTDLRLY